MFNVSFPRFDPGVVQVNKKKPSRYSSKQVQQSHGIRTWLSEKLQVTQTQHQDEYISEFCKTEGFEKKSDKGNLLVIMETFISNRFTKFATWAAEYKKNKDQSTA